MGGLFLIIAWVLPLYYGFSKSPVLISLIIASLIITTIYILISIPKVYDFYQSKKLFRFMSGLLISNTIISLLLIGIGRLLSSVF